MKIMAELLLGVILGMLLVGPVGAQSGRKFDFSSDTVGKESSAFSPVVGTWRIALDGITHVYAVDGRSRQGLLSPKASENAIALFGEKTPEFIKGVSFYKEFPLTINKEFGNFKNGTLLISFKALGGKEDQAAGIAFNIRPDGEYLAVRANALENNLALFAFDKGKRSPLQEINDVPTPSNQWHILKVTIKGEKIEASLDDKKYIDYAFKNSINGKVGLWSKADSYTLFDKFEVQQD